MRDILLVVIMPAIFVLGYFAANVFGRLIDESFRKTQEPQNKALAEQNGPERGETHPEETGRAADTAADNEGYEIIILKPVGRDVIKNLEESGCRIKYDIRQ